MSLQFEWDNIKAKSNIKKHELSFEEARTVFSDSQARIFDDNIHSSETEKRELIVGHSIKNRLLIVCFTEREDIIRIFSSPKATKKEREDYEESTRL